MKRVRKILVIMMLVSYILGLSVLQVNAAENSDEVSITELNQIMTIAIDCDAKKLPQRGAEVVTSYTAGSTVWVVGETHDGWYKVSYQGQLGYIPKDYIVELQVEVEGKGTAGLREAGLDEEMAALEAENEMIIDEIERQRREVKRSRVWTIVIVILVIGIFLTGIISTIKVRKDATKDEIKGDKDNENSTIDDMSKEAGNSIEMIDLDTEEE